MGPTELRVAEKCLYGDFRFVKGSGDLSHQTQQVWSKSDRSACRGQLGGDAPSSPRQPSLSNTTRLPVPLLQAILGGSIRPAVARIVTTPLPPQHLLQNPILGEECPTATGVPTDKGGRDPAEKVAFSDTSKVKKN